MSSYTSNGTKPFSYETYKPENQSYQSKLTSATLDDQSYQSGVSELASATLEHQSYRSDVSELTSATLPEPKHYEVKTEFSVSKVDSLSLSDSAQLVGWQSSRQTSTYQQVPLSAPTKPKYKFSLHEAPGVSFSVGPQRVFPKPLSRAEMVSGGLGASVQRAPECTICFEEFTEDGLKTPLLLSCGHSYCTGAST